MKNRLLKIKALLNSPEKGERDSAEKMLTKLMKKHNITAKDLEEKESRVKFEFKYFHKYELNLLFQIYCKVLNVNSITYNKVYGKRAVRFQLTYLEFDQMSYLYKVYRKKFKKEMEKIIATASQAFFSKHDLFSNIKSEETTEKSDFDLELFTQLYNQMKNINPYFNQKPNNERKKLS